jgi:hypothetical protein
VTYDPGKNCCRTLSASHTGCHARRQLMQGITPHASDIMFLLNSRVEGINLLQYVLPIVSKHIQQ